MPYKLFTKLYKVLNDKIKVNQDQCYNSVNELCCVAYRWVTGKQKGLKAMYVGD